MILHIISTISKYCHACTSLIIDECSQCDPGTTDFMKEANHIRPAKNFRENEKV